MSRVKILHVIDSLGPGGAQVALENLVRFGNHDRFEYHVAALHGEGVYAPKLRSLGATVFSCAGSKLDPRWPLRLLGWIRANRPAIVHTHLVVSAAAVESLLPLMPRGTRYVAHLQNVVAESTDFAYQNVLERHVYRRAHAVVAVSAAVRKSYGRTHPIDARLSVIHNGVDDARLTGCDPDRRRAVRLREGVDERDHVIFSAGRLIGQKNFEYALKVMSCLSREDPIARYWIAGSGPEEARLRQLVTELNLSERVRFLGYREDIPDLLAAADVYLMPSLFEGLPMILAEAMGAGCIPVVTPFAAAREMVRDGWSGRVIPFGDVHKSATCLYELFHGDSSIRESMAGRSVALARRRFAASRMTSRVEGVYTALLAEAPP